MTDNATSAYWRKYLKIDEPVDEGYLRQFHSRLEILRPIEFFLINILSKYYFRAEVYGVKNIPEPPYIIAPNHCSAMDQPLVAWAIGAKRRKDLYTLATKFFFDNAFVRLVMKSGANIVRIDTVSDYIPAMQSACKILKLGRSVYINPEGTRSEDGDLLPFRTGVGVVAVENGVPIIPVYIDGTHKALPPGAPFPKPYKVKVYFDKPIKINEYIEKKKIKAAYDVYKEVTDELYRRIIALKNMRKN